MHLTRAQIAELIPHSGAMCLLERVVRWDANRILCASRTHLVADNPLRAGERLPALCGVEYAVQCMAVHGGLTGKVSGRPRLGYLASLRDVECRSERLDDLDGELQIEVELLASDDAHASYRFRLRVGELEVLIGRALVVLDGDRAAK